jgi:hypothetical protein
MAIKVPNKHTINGNDADREAQTENYKERVLILHAPLIGGKLLKIETVLF